jgi:hypothetical protein
MRAFWRIPLRRQAIAAAPGVIPGGFPDRGLEAPGDPSDSWFEVEENTEDSSLVWL